MRFRLFNKDLGLVEKASKIIHFLVKFSLIIAFISAFLVGNWTVLFVAGLTFILISLPSLFEKRYKIDIPVEFEIIIVIFLYASIFLGEVHGYYTKFWWWDIILHTGSGFVLGFLGFIILYIFYKGNKIKADPLTIVIFSFCFAVAIGAVWEIFEFAMDQIFILNMQKSGLNDTMWDLIVDSIGALFASFLGYIYLKKGEVFLFKKVVKNFEKQNPRLFKK